MRTLNFKTNRGFTLMEMIVVMAVFLLVIGAALSILISIFQHQRRILSEQELLNQISYAEEYMSKATRMAKAELDEDCLGAPGYIYLFTRYNSVLGRYLGIKFINQSDIDLDGNPACQEFFLDNETNPGHPVLKELKNSSNDADAVALTSDNLLIDPDNPIRFSINGSGGGTFESPSCTDQELCGASELDDVQPRVTILLNVRVASNNESFRSIQTTVSQRNLNVK